MGCENLNSFHRSCNKHVRWDLSRTPFVVCPALGSNTKEDLERLVLGQCLEPSDAREVVASCRGEQKVAGNVRQRQTVVVVAVLILERLTGRAHCIVRHRRS